MKHKRRYFEEEEEKKIVYKMKVSGVQNKQY